MSLAPWVSFVEACRLGTLSETAKVLGYTQSAVSRQIATLEHEVGAALLVREARGVRPTPAGQSLLPHARMVVAEASRGRRAAESATPARHVAIGAVPSAALSLVPVSLARVAPPLAWTLVTGLTPDLVDRVSSGELDVAVVTDVPPGLPRTAGIHAVRVAEDRMAVALRDTHPLAGRRRVSVRDLATERWLEDNRGSEALLHQLAAAEGITVDVDRSPGDLAVKTALVAAGHGIALVPRLVEPSLRPDVRLVDLVRAPRRGIYAVTTGDREDLAGLVAALRTT